MQDSVLIRTKETLTIRHANVRLKSCLKMCTRPKAVAGPLDGRTLFGCSCYFPNICRSSGSAKVIPYKLGLCCVAVTHIILYYLCSAVKITLTLLEWRIIYFYFYFTIEFKNSVLHEVVTVYLRMNCVLSCSFRVFFAIG